MGTNGPWNWRLTVPKTTKVMLVRPLMTNLKMTVLFLHVNAPPHNTHIHTHTHTVYESSLCLLVGTGGGRGWSLVRHPPPHPSCRCWKESKLSFLPTWPVCWLLSDEQPDPTPPSPTNSSGNNMVDETLRGAWLEPPCADGKNCP